MIRQSSLFGKLFIIVSLLVEVSIHSSSAGEEWKRSYNKQTTGFTRLQILGLFPYRGSFWNGEYVIPAARLARDEINRNDSGILPGFELELIEINSGCDRDRGVREFVSNALHSAHKPVAILGTGCSSSTIAIACIAGRDNIRLPQVSYGATSPILSLISSYPYFFRTVTSDESSSGAIINLFQQFKWKRYGILMVGFDKTWVQHSFSSLRAGIQYHIDDAEEVYSGSIGQPRDEGETLDDYFQFIDLNEIRSSNMRVGILVAGREASRDTMCYLYRQNLVYPRIIWLHLSDACALLNGSTNGYCKGNDEFQQAMEGSICLRYKLTTADNNTISVTGKTFDQYYGSYVNESRKYAAEKGDNYNSSLLNDWATLVYDSMWVLGQALHNTEEKLSQLNLSVADFTLGNSKISGMIMEEIAGVSFAGASGQVIFDEAHKRDLSTLFIQPQRLGVLNTLGLYHPLRNGAGWDSLYVNNAVLLWSVDNPPSDQFPAEIMLAQMWAGALMLLFLILGFVWNSFSMLINFHYQNFYLIKASSPVLNYMIFAGNNLLLLSGILLVISAIAEHDMVTFSILCQGKQWLFDLGLLLILNTTLLKSWRIYRIFYSFKRKPGKLATDNAIIAASIGWVFINTTYHTVFTLVNKSNIVKKTLMATKEDDLHQKILVYCQPSKLISLFYIPHFVMSVTLCLLAFLIRRVYRKHFNDVKHKHFNNAKHIAIFFYTTLPIVTICLALSDLLSPVNDVYNLTTVSLILECTAVNCIVFMCQSTLFVPKILPLFRQLYSHS